MAYYNAKQRLKELLGSYSAEEEKLGQIYKTALENAENSYKASLASARAEAERKRSRAIGDNAQNEREYMELLATRGLGFSGEAAQAKLNSNLSLESRLSDIDREAAEEERGLAEGLNEYRSELEKERLSETKALREEKTELYKDLAELEASEKGESGSKGESNSGGNGNTDDLPLPEFNPEATPKELAKLLVTSATDDGYIRSDYDEYLINRYMLELYEDYDLPDGYIKELVFMLKAYGYPESDISDMRIQVISRDAKEYYDKRYKKLYDSAVLSGKHALSASAYAAETAESDLLSMIFTRTKSDTEFLDVCENAGIMNYVATAYLESHRRGTEIKGGKGGSGIMKNEVK